MSDEKNINDEEIKKEEEECEKSISDLEAAEKKMAEYLDGWKRAKADYMNLKKEAEQRYKDLIKFANAGLILELLPVLDNFKLAVMHIPESEKNADWVIGIMHIKKQFEDILKNLGIEEIKTVGEKFNPELHEAVGRESAFASSSAEAAAGKERKEGEEGKIPLTPFTKGGTQGDDIIIKEVRAGYTMHGKVIQAARVIVS
ncbi:MAG: nucleotide exchange factor GrpE [bacterium]